VFTDEEIAYIRSQRLARVATVSVDGQPDLVPVGFEFDGSAFHVGATTRPRHGGRRTFGPGTPKWHC
jgi:pyridoxamine 5'-phosphate oxidase family protein